MTPMSSLLRMFRANRIIPSLGLLIIVGTVQGAPRAAEWSVKAEPARIVNGSPVLFRVIAPATFKELKGTFLGQELSFRSSADCHCWYAIAGVSLNTKPGRYTLHLTGKTAAAKTNFDDVVAVGAAHYPSSTLKVAPAFVEPPKEEMARIEEDQAAKKQVFSVTQPEPRWSGQFQAPAEAVTSGVFGTARVFNGVKKSQHTGLD
ncbi:MAG TPA: hypothetical protein VE133_14545, partial [Candidatus Sulfotelmatobacter sp.]|nr:hypothetical protein [Candidatus Sulfotelmatobacter sp.]